MPTCSTGPTCSRTSRRRTVPSWPGCSGRFRSRWSRNRRCASAEPDELEGHPTHVDACERGDRTVDAGDVVGTVDRDAGGAGRRTEAFDVAYPEAQRGDAGLDRTTQCGRDLDELQDPLARADDRAPCGAVRLRPAEADRGLLAGRLEPIDRPDTRELEEPQHLIEVRHEDDGLDGSRWHRSLPFELGGQRCCITACIVSACSSPTVK